MQIALQSEKIFIANKAIDFRKAIDGLCALIVCEMQQEPHSGIYIFYNKSFDRLKILGWHKNGFVMVYKRLERGKFFLHQDAGINSQQLNWLLSGIDWKLLADVKCDYNAYF